MKKLSLYRDLNPRLEFWHIVTHWPRSFDTFYFDPDMLFVLTIIRPTIWFMAQKMALRDDNNIILSFVMTYFITNTGYTWMIWQVLLQKKCNVYNR